MLPKTNRIRMTATVSGESLSPEWSPWNTPVAPDRV